MLLPRRMLDVIGILSRDDCSIGSLAENPSSNQVLPRTLADVFQSNEECSLVPEWRRQDSEKQMSAQSIVPEF